MKILGAILFTLGVSQMSFGQDTKLNCPDGTSQHHDQLNREGETMIFDEPSASAEIQGEDQNQNNDLKFNYKQGETEINLERGNQGTGEIEINDEPSAKLNDASDFEQESEVEIEGNDYSYEMEAETEEADLNTMQPVATTDVVVVAPELTLEEERKESTIENVVEAPFKAGFTLVSETAEGVGHIVGAPFKAIGKLFGRDEDSNN